MTVRRFVGRRADLIAIVCRPAPGPAAADTQAEAVYRSLAALLGEHGALPRDLLAETLFLRDIRRDLPEVLAVRERVLPDLAQSPLAPAAIGQAPLEPAALLELAASVVVPHRRDGWTAGEIRARPACSCAGCLRSGARLVSSGEQTSLGTSILYGTGSDPFEQVRDMLRTAEGLLESCGMDFRNVIRTWIHLRHIERDYDALNRARRELFRQRGVDPRPASTGVGGIPFPDEHDCALRLQAIRSAGALEMAAISTPFLNEAWSYGVDFSRGLKVVESNQITLHVSGTASIDEAGRTVHAGNFEAQAERMLDNIAGLLAAEGAGFADVISAVTYVKDARDRQALGAVCRRRGFEGFPWVRVQAALCRPDLLCETEAVALLPLRPAAAY